MKPVATLTVIVMTFAQAWPILAQESEGPPPSSFDEATNPGQRFVPFVLPDPSRMPLTVTANSRPAQGVPIRRASEPPAAAHYGRRVSGRRLLIGALIGGAAGAALGYHLGSKCVLGAPRAECVADGRLVAGVFGALGGLIGVGIAAKTAP
jgi:hypothetical protein